MLKTREGGSQGKESEKNANFPQGSRLGAACNREKHDAFDLNQTRGLHTRKRGGITKKTHTTKKKKSREKNCGTA